MKKMSGPLLVILAALICDADATGGFEHVPSKAAIQEEMREHQRQEGDRSMMREVDKEMETLRKQLKVYKRLREQSRKGPLDEGARSHLESEEDGLKYTAELVRQKIKDLGSQKNRLNEERRLNTFMDIYERDRG